MGNPERGGHLSYPRPRIPRTRPEADRAEGGYEPRHCHACGTRKPEAGAERIKGQP